MTLLSLNLFFLDKRSGSLKSSKKGFGSRQTKSHLNIVRCIVVICDQLRWAESAKFYAALRSISRASSRIFRCQQKSMECKIGKKNLVRNEMQNIEMSRPSLALGYWLLYLQLQVVQLYFSAPVAQLLSSPNKRGCLSTASCRIYVYPSSDRTSIAALVKVMSFLPPSAAVYMCGFVFFFFLFFFF